MKRLLLCILIVPAVSAAFSQKWYIDAGAGIAGYSGDLTQTSPTLKTIGPHAGIIFKYALGKNVLLRSGFNWGVVTAHDKNNKDTLLLRRNLSFKSHVIEGSLGIEVNLISPDDADVYPYLFVGAGVFHFNPFAEDDSGEKNFLKPLSTEGQGLSEYPARKEYKLTQFCIPFGGGLKIKLNEKLDVGFELGFRKTFTDYLDDVSTRYIDYHVLLNRKGQKAVEMAFRSLNAAGVPTEPVFDDIRGNPDKKDWYYFIGLKLILKINKSAKKDTETDQ